MPEVGGVVHTHSTYATAWAALIGYGSLRPGERVLVHSAGGGVGICRFIEKKCDLASQRLSFRRG